MPTTASPHAAPCCMKNLPTLTSLCPPRSNWRLDARLGSNRIARRHREIVRGAATPFVAALPGPPPECFSSFDVFALVGGGRGEPRVERRRRRHRLLAVLVVGARRTRPSRARASGSAGTTALAPQITGTRAGGRFATESKNDFLALVLAPAGRVVRASP